jgi:glutamate dehydrogenase (NADP+)
MTIDGGNICDRGEYAAPGNYAAGANIAGFLRVGRAMLAFGVI